MAAASRQIGIDRPQSARRVRRGHAGAERDARGKTARPQPTRDELCPNRLRHMLKDALFVRSPKGMLPTPRAEELAPPLRQALDGLQHSLEPADFDPSRSATFRIAADNYAAIVLVPPSRPRRPLMRPSVTLEFLPSGTLDISIFSIVGQLELAIGSFAIQAERFSSTAIAARQFRRAVAQETSERRPAHEINDGEVRGIAAPRNLLAAPQPTDFIDDALARRQLTPG